jgi:photosynthetic reaction center cytochrome c subunit
MKKIYLILFIVFLVWTSIGFSGTGNERPKSFSDSLADEREKFLRQILDSLKGKENRSADSVFKNIRTFRGAGSIPVKHLLAVMDYWGEALSVNCTYCHNSQNWASDELKDKRIARDMYRMRDVINKELLPQMKDLSTSTSRVNCTTCHHGSPIPDH